MKDVLENLKKKIKETDADYLDIRLEEKKGTSFSIKKGEVENIAETDKVGYGVRTLYKGRWGFASGTNLEKIEDKIAEAVSFAKMAGNKKSQFAKVPVYKDDVPSDMKTDPTKLPLDKKIKLFLDYYKIVSKYDKKIQDSSALGYSDIKTKKYFLNSEGSYIIQEIRRAGYRIIINARKGQNIKTLSNSKSSLKDYNVIYGLEDEIKSQCKKCLEVLDAKPVKAGTYTVIGDQEIAGLFAHEAFGHLSEADSVYKDEKMQKIMRLGRKFGKPILNILDNPSLKGKYGSYKYDDDGVKTQKNYLIKKGKLMGRLHSRETAAMTGEKPTGNSRAISSSYEPIVRMSNTYIENGRSTFEEMLKGIKKGVYAVGFMGGQTSYENFVFTADCGYMIRDGKLAEMVRDVQMMGNVFKTIEDIDMIGNDFKAFETLGGCGKGGQSPLPVSDGGPHIRMQNVIIGGE